MSIMSVPEDLLYTIAMYAANLNVFAVVREFYKHRSRIISELALRISDISDPNTAGLLCLLNSATKSILNIHPAVRFDTSIINLMLRRTEGKDYVNLDDSLKEHFFQTALIYSDGFMFINLPSKIQSFTEAIDIAADLIGIRSESNLSSQELASTIHDIIVYSDPYVVA